MSRTEEKTGEAADGAERAGGASESGTDGSSGSVGVHRERSRSGTRERVQPADLDLDGNSSESGIRVAAHLGTAARATFQRAAAACSPEAKADESERALLIGSIARLIRDESTPEPTRIAGLTLIGWLARRRTHETPHAIGVDEARESQRRSRKRP